MYGELTRWGLRKNATFCYEQILKATSLKTEALFPKQLYTTYNFGGSMKSQWFSWETGRRVVILELMVLKGPYLATFVNPCTRYNIGNHLSIRTWHSTKYHIPSMKTYWKPKWMEWFIYNENVHGGGERKEKNKIKWENTLFDCPPSPPNRSGEPTVFKFPGGPKTIRTIPIWDEGLNLLDKRNIGKGTERSW